MFELKNIKECVLNEIETKNINACRNLEESSCSRDSNNIDRKMINRFYDFTKISISTCGAKCILNTSYISSQTKSLKSKSVDTPCM